MRNFYFLFLFFLAPNCFAQLTNLPIGGRAMGLGGSTVTLQDGWGIFNNVAGISDSEQMSAGFAYHYPYSLAPLSTASAYFVSPLRFGAIGVSVQKFGDNLFSEQKISLGYASKISNIDLGFRVNYHQLSADGAGSKGVPSFDFGVITQLTDEIYLGAKANNITQTKLLDFEDERLPSTISLGISYRPNNKLMVNIEANKDVEFDPAFLGGVEYRIVDKLLVRGGFSSEPNAVYFGVGFDLKKIDIDYSLNNHAVLGISQQLSIKVDLKKVEKKKVEK
jgi:hypothetical protein